MKRSTLVCMATAVVLALSSVGDTPALAQGLASDSRSASRPTPRWPDGRVNLGAPIGETGNWAGSARPALATGIERASGLNLPINPTLGEVPFQPWARALFDYRESTSDKDDPHTRCLPSGGPRIFQTPYGTEILQLPEDKEILILGIGGPHSWRVVYMDGRPHPTGADLRPSYYGHSVGRWEGDTLVIESVGYNERFWMARDGFPHTEALRLIERISRPDFDTLRYEVTIDDPRAYTERWTAGFFVRWQENELFEYICQENNLDPERMVGAQVSAP